MLKLCRLFSLISLSFILFTFVSIWHNFALNDFRHVLDSKFCSMPSETITPLYGPQLHKNIAIASGFGSHHDVFLALAWTLERVMTKGSKLTVYAPLPFSYGFQDIVDDLDMFHGPLKDSQELIRDIITDPGEGGIDMVILGTCEVDMNAFGSDLLAAWNSRSASNKFQLVCIVHHAEDVGWQSAIPEWSRRNSLRLLTISEHVVNAFHRAHDDLSYSPDPKLYSAGYEYIPADTHIPVLDIQNLPTLSPRRILSNAVIQGYFDIDRRDYDGIFEQLIQSLNEDPKIWGYHPLSATRFKYTHDTSLSNPPFRLHLAGAGSMPVPPELEDVVVFHVGLEYNDYYNLMGSMDICLPAFAGTGKEYFESQASSTVAMCIEVNTPLLVTRRMRDSYTYIDDDRVVVTRPAAIREIDAIKALRTGNASSLYTSDPSNTGWSLDSHPHIRDGVQKMMREGWVRPKEGFDAVKKDIWHHNDVVAWRLLRDM